MFHPGVDTQKIKNMNEEEYFEEITKLQKRLNMAHKMGKQDLILQLKSIIFSYETAWSDKHLEDALEQLANDPEYTKTSIDIDWPDPAEEKEKKKNEI